MAVKVRKKTDEKIPSGQTQPSLKIPVITPPNVSTPNIIIRAVKIMLMDIRLLLSPKQTREDLEKYSQFADYAYGRK